MAWYWISEKSLLITYSIQMLTKVIDDISGNMCYCSDCWGSWMGGRSWDHMTDGYHAAHNHATFIPSFLSFLGYLAEL